MTVSHHDLMGTPFKDARQLPAAYQKEKQAGYEVPILPLLRFRELLFLFGLNIE